MKEIHRNLPRICYGAKTVLKHKLQKNFNSYRTQCRSAAPSQFKMKCAEIRGILKKCRITFHCVGYWRKNVSDRRVSKSKGKHGQQNNEDIIITMTNKEDIITIERGQKFTIILDSNPTTGFKWLPTFNRSIISLISHEFQSRSPTAIGRSGNDIFTFFAIRYGSDKLKMKYKRSWEEQPVAEKVFLINVK